MKTSSGLEHLLGPSFRSCTSQTLLLEGHPGLGCCGCTLPCATSASSSSRDTVQCSFAALKRHDCLLSAGSAASPTKFDVLAAVSGVSHVLSPTLSGRVSQVQMLLKSDSPCTLLVRFSMDLFKVSSSRRFFSSSSAAEESPDSASPRASILALSSFLLLRRLSLSSISSIFFLFPSYVCTMRTMMESSTTTTYLVLYFRKLE